VGAVRTNFFPTRPPIRLCGLSCNFPFLHWEWNFLKGWWVGKDKILLEEGGLW
jgi:hypothetical protein